jgi:hypothetical protein
MIKRLPPPPFFCPLLFKFGLGGIESMPSPPPGHADRPPYKFKSGLSNVPEINFGNWHNPLFYALFSKVDIRQLFCYQRRLNYVK